MIVVPVMLWWGPIVSFVLTIARGPWTDRFQWEKGNFYHLRNLFRPNHHLYHAHCEQLQSSQHFKTGQQRRINLLRQTGQAGGGGGNKFHNLGTLLCAAGYVLQPGGGRFIRALRLRPHLNGQGSRQRSRLPNLSSGGRGQLMRFETGQSSKIHHHHHHCNYFEYRSCLSSSSSS